MLEEEVINNIFQTRKNAGRLIVFGIAMEPNESLSPAVIEHSAHEWMMRGCPFDGGKVVESYIAPMELKLGETRIKKGSWILGVRQE